MAEGVCLGHVGFRSFFILLRHLLSSYAKSLHIQSNVRFQACVTHLRATDAIGRSPRDYFSAPFRARLGFPAAALYRDKQRY